LTGLARLEMQDIFLVETLLYKILIRQDCYHQFGDQENGSQMIDEFG
jgi:hypothetical protein